MFWNLRGASASDICVHSLAASEKPDLFALAEHAAFDDAKPPSGYHYTRISKRLALLATRTVSIVSPAGPLRDFAKIIQIDGWSIAICHLKSPLADGAAERNRHLRMLKAHLQSSVLFWTKLAVVGDLNLNPWEEPLVDKESLHALQTRNEAISRASLQWRTLSGTAERKLSASPLVPRRKRRGVGHLQIQGRKTSLVFALAHPGSGAGFAGR